jgi:hypothetical protein
MTALEQLNIEDCPNITDKAFDYLSNLRSLSVSSGPITMRGISKLSKLTDLCWHVEDETSEALSAEHLSLLPRSVTHLKVTGSCRTSDAALTKLSYVEHLTLHNPTGNLSGAFLNHLPALQKLTLYECSNVHIKLLVAALQRFMDKPEALAEVLASVNMELEDEDLDTGVLTVMSTAIKHYRANLRMLVHLCKHQFVNGRNYLVEAVAVHVKLPASKLSQERPAPLYAEKLMPVIWKAMARKLDWSPIECEALNVIGRCKGTLHGCSTHEVMTLLLERLCTTDTDADASRFLSECIRTLSSRDECKELLLSRAGLTTVVQILSRKRHGLAAGELADALSDANLSPEIKFLFWELGGIDALLMREFSGTALNLFPVHSPVAARSFLDSGKLTEMSALLSPAPNDRVALKKFEQSLRASAAKE